jgi:hypothetical protein
LQRRLELVGMDDSSQRHREIAANAYGQGCAPGGLLEEVKRNN